MVSSFFIRNKIICYNEKEKWKSAQEETCLDTSRLSSDEGNVLVQRWFESTQHLKKFLLFFLIRKKIICYNEKDILEQ